MTCLADEIIVVPFKNQFYRSLSEKKQRFITRNGEVCSFQDMNNRFFERSDFHLRLYIPSPFFKRWAKMNRVEMRRLAGNIISSPSPWNEKREAEHERDKRNALVSLLRNILIFPICWSLPARRSRKLFIMVYNHILPGLTLLETHNESHAPWVPPYDTSSGKL